MAASWRVPHAEGLPGLRGVAGADDEGVHTPRSFARVLALVLLASTAAACSGADAQAVHEPDLVVGIITVGPVDDLGYNQAVAEGARALARRLPNVRVVLRTDVPEDERAEQVLQELVDDEGAGLLLATSFGHLDAARAVATGNPDVVVLHQGALEGDPDLPNLGTYWGSDEEVMLEAGVAAGLATTSGRIGMVAAYPISTTWSVSSALLLGARTARPDAVVDLAISGSWCDPDGQVAAAQRLLDDGADVLAMHVDCTAPLLELAEERGVPVVGYHVDGSEVAPDAWLVGVVWSWADTYEAITRTVLDGSFADSRFAGDWRGSSDADDNPVVRASFGPALPPEARDRALDLVATAPEPFVGPLLGSDGRVLAGPGEVLDRIALDAMDVPVVGVVGDVP